MGLLLWNEFSHLMPVNILEYKPRIASIRKPKSRGARLTSALSGFRNRSIFYYGDHKETAAEIASPGARITSMADLLDQI
jgi:hypothetical protein